MTASKAEHTIDQAIDRAISQPCFNDCLQLACLLRRKAQTVEDSYHKKTGQPLFAPTQSDTVDECGPVAHIKMEPDFEEMGGEWNANKRMRMAEYFERFANQLRVTASVMRQQSKPLPKQSPTEFSTAIAATN